MFQLKPISREGIPAAIEKAERYRLINEPLLSESICLDILEADPQHDKALIILILAITDQFSSSSGDVNRARQLLPRLKNEYEKNYYSGIICEREGMAIFNRGGMMSSRFAHEWLTEAMEFYEKAESIRPAGNDDALLRWNTCARMIQRHNLKPVNEKYVEPPLE